MLDFQLNCDAEEMLAERVPFAGSLGVADLNGQSPPDQGAFKAVAGFNLSHTGISFATQDWPTNDRLLVALGDERSPVLVAAHIIACEKRTDRHDRVAFEVQCAFDQWYT